MAENEKKKWIKPELNILVRGESEEAVLEGCKGHGSLWGEGPFNVDCLTWMPAQFCNAPGNS